MAHKFTPIAFSALILVSACGSSNSSKSDKNNCTPANNTNPSKFVNIRLPSSTPTTPGNANGPGMPTTTPNMDNAPTTDNCGTAQPGNLGETPTGPNNTNVPNTPNSPVPPNLPQGPSSPTVGNPRNPSPTLNVGNINGRWEFTSDFCEDGTQTADMQKVFQMMMNGDFNQSLTIKDSTVEEFTWLRLSIDPNDNNTMMCTLMRKSSLTRVGNDFRLSRPAANFDDAGGLTPCNLQPVAAQTIEKLRMSAQGGVLVIEIPNSKECSGRSRVQLYSASNPN